MTTRRLFLGALGVIPSGIAANQARAGTATYSATAIEQGCVTVKDFGAIGDGVADDTIAIIEALAVSSVIKFPVGVYQVTKTIVIPNGVTLEGADRSTTLINYVGTGDALRNTNGPNSSGYGCVTIRNLKITTTSHGNVGAGIDFQSGGYAFYEVDTCHITGAFKYGIILDGSEVAHVHHSIIENSGTTNVWIANGPEHTATQASGFSNVITIADNQLNGTGVGLVDDGGNNHNITGNNFNGHAQAARFCGTTNIVFVGNAIENLAANVTSASTANLLLTDVSGVGGTSKGVNNGGLIQGNSFSGHLVAGSSSLIQTVSQMGYHTGITISGGNVFYDRLGRGNAIDVSRLADSFCGFNVDHGNMRMGHYSSVTDARANGNTLYPPQNAAEVARKGVFSHQNTSMPHAYYGGVNAQAGGFLLLGQKLQSFSLGIRNSGGTIQHCIVGGPNNQLTPAFADKISGALGSWSNTPTLDGGSNFIGGAGICGGATHVVVLNTAQQNSANMFAFTTVEYYDGNSASGHPTAVASFVGRNVSGIARNRLELSLHKQSTAEGWTVDKVNLPSGKSIFIKVLSWLV